MLVSRLGDRLIVSGLLAILLLMTAMLVGALAEIELRTPALLASTVVLLAGTLSTFWRDPTRLDAAVAIDQLNQTSELLSTAWSLRQRDDPWSQQIVNIAQHAAADMRLPSAASRYGGRALGAVMLALCATLVGGTLVNESTGRAADPLTLLQTGDRAAQDARQTLAMRTSNSSGEVESGMAPQDAASSDNTPQAARGDRQRPGNGAASTGLGRGDIRQVNAWTPSEGDHASLPTRDHPARPGDESGSGTGLASTDQPAGSSGRAGTVVIEPTPASAAPWQSADWPTSQAAVERALKAGEFAPAYRPLIREYFQR